jgi:peptide/nickel transport system ATP-binding protein/oligopeptide transport system ATP-binding protein
MALVVQSPKSSLDPLTRIGDQLIRTHLAHRKVTRSAARARALQMLQDVGIPDAERRLRAWPHELSGGMAQRVLIALALMNQPRLLIADEPTTGLDVTVQAQILDLLRGIVRRESLGAIIITHDLGVVAHYCDEVLVMFAGSVVERGPVDGVFSEPRHPYTINLVAATPERLKLGHTHVMGGAPPNLHALPSGCIYRVRCPRAAAICATPPPSRDVGGGHTAACHFVEAAA